MKTRCYSFTVSLFFVVFAPRAYGHSLGEGYIFLHVKETSIEGASPVGSVMR